jgi:hypothetical protein
MRRLGVLVLALLVACSAGAKPATTPDTKPATTPDTPGVYIAPPLPDDQPRHHWDMTTYGGMSRTCDAPLGLTVRTIVQHQVKNPDWDVVRARIVSIGAPRWNTASGKRPTQAEADAIVDGPLEYGEQVNPTIYRPVVIQVEKVYSGKTNGTKTVYAESGRIGNNRFTSCGFGSADELLIRSGPLVATVGESYVMLLQPRRRFGTTINEVFLIKGSLVVGLTNKLEPLP